MATHKYYQGQHFVSRGYFWGKLLASPARVFFSFPFQKTVYHISWPFLMIFFKFFVHFETESQENLKKLEGPLIVASSHISWMDPFLIGISLPFWSKLFPVRYACWHKYYYSIRFLAIPWLFGSFPIEKGVGLDKALKTPVELLKKGQVIGIFPEGKRTMRGESKGKRGAAYLAFKTQAKILPIKIEGNPNRGVLNFLFRGQRMKVKIGKAFALPHQRVNSVEDLNEPTNLIMEQIQKL